MSTAAATAPVLSLRNIRKTFGGVVALEDFSLDLHAGRIVALVGDNGAGKSTVVKVICGVHAPDSGSMLLDGEPASFRDARGARAHGVEVVHQDLALASRQSVYMNVFLGREETTGPVRRLHRVRMIRETRRLLDELDVHVPSVRSAVRDLSGGQRQGIAIARATHWARKIILLDEPTAALGVAETAKVERQIDALRARELAILMVSHNLDQVFRLADEVCVLRRGAKVGVRAIADTDRNQVVSMVTGVAWRSE